MSGLKDQDHNEEDEQECGTEGKRGTSQPSTEREEPQTSEELVGVSDSIPIVVVTEEFERGGIKEMDPHQEKEVVMKVESEGEKHHPGVGGEGDNNCRGAEGERVKTPIPPPRRKRKKRLKKNPSLENLEVYVT